MKNIITICLILIVIPLIIVMGVNLFNGRKYNIISIGIILVSMFPIFYKYEKKDSSMLLIVLIAVLAAIAIVGRVAFFMVPFVKPMSAVIIIAGMYLGSEEGFLVGALAAVGSNVIYGQGPWTPFQMFSWGLIGFIAGIPFISKKCQKNKIYLVLLGIISGILFSVIMDSWSVLNFQSFSWTRYLAMLARSLPMTVTYMISNAIFLLVLYKPIGDVLKRIQVKYGF